MRNIIKKILRESEDFGWIKDIKPRGDEEIKVGDYFYIIDHHPKQWRKLGEVSRLRYLMKVVNILDIGGNTWVFHPSIEIDTLHNDGIEQFYSDDTGEFWGREDELPDEYDLFDEEIELINLKDAKRLIKNGYWRYTDNPKTILNAIYGENRIEP
jgi:hypothetical protein